MARIEPFRGLRYNPQIVKDVSRVVAPPYDVISPQQRIKLNRKDPHNIVRLILPKDPPHVAHGDRYRMAARYLETWLEKKVLIEDPEPAIYVLDDTFQHDGETYTRRSFVAAVRLEKLGKGAIFPHEETMPGPVADRLKLLESTRTNLSPIFALFLDDGETQAVLDSAPISKPLHTAVDQDDVRTSLRVITDRDAIAALQASMLSRTLLIADGHHRYETALAYRGPKPTGKLHDYVMMACISSLDPGLLILPTHRVIKAGDTFDEGRFFRRAAGKFEVTRLRVSESHPADVLLNAIDKIDRHVFGVYTSSGQMAVLRLLDDDLVMENPAPHTDEWKQLEVAVLHRFILLELLDIDSDAAKDGERVKYSRDASKVVELVQQGKYDVALLIKPTRISQMKCVAAANERMPPKSTYFYPKLPCGLVLRRLESQ